MNQTRVVVELPAELSRYSEGRREIEVEATTYDEVLTALFEQLPDLQLRMVGESGDLNGHLAVFQNGARIASKNVTELENGDRIEFVAIASGG